MDRFTNSYENEYAWCEAGCGRKFHYTELNNEGYCQRCAEEITELREYNKKRNHTKIKNESEANDVTK